MINLLQLLACLVSIFIAFPVVQAEERHTYLESTGEDVHPFDWTLSTSDDHVEIVALQGCNRYFTRCSPDGATREWRFESSNDSIRVVLEDDKLVVEAQKGDDEIVREFEIDENPWFQTLSYSLRRFNASEQQSLLFWHLRQDTLEPVKMMARKITCTTGRVCAGQSADLIEIRPAGVLSNLWHASYWFRQNDNVFCRYEGRHGTFMTPVTVISLQPEE